MNLKQLFNDYQNANGFAQYSPSELYEPLGYILSLGGKQIRPLLVLMACRLFSKEVEAALPVAYAVEVFHNFSLLHDDIMDESPLRRGQATVHKKYNTNTAILSGDVMLVYAYEYISKVAPALLPDILSVFNRVAIGVCEGQQMDMNFETQKQVSIAEYVRMIELKTSILLYGAMKMGALVGGASPSDAELVGEFGRNMGLAFQIQDDFLDTFGQKAALGKRIGGDILQNKKTYLVLKALELADTTTKIELAQWLSSSPSTAEEEATKIAKVTAIFTDLGIPAQMKATIKDYSDKAAAHIAQLDCPAEAKQPLLDFLAKLMVREY